MGSDLWPMQVAPSKRCFADLTDVTLADEDTKPILTDNVNESYETW